MREVKQYKVWVEEAAIAAVADEVLSRRLPIHLMVDIFQEVRNGRQGRRVLAEYYEGFDILQLKQIIVRHSVRCKCNNNNL